MFVVTDAILGASQLRQVSNSSHRSGAAVRPARFSGGAAVQQIYGVSMEEVTSLTTSDVENVVGLNSGNFLDDGLSILSGTITVPYKDRANGGKFAGAASHSQLSGSNALVIPTGISVSQGEAATANLEVHWISSDGFTQAITSSGGNTLASELFNAQFSLGPVTINGTAINSVTGFQVNPGITLVKQSAKGGNWPTEISIQQVDPSIDVTFVDVGELDAVLDDFFAGVLVAYLRKCSDGGKYEADASLVHTRFNFAAGVSHAESIEAPETGNGSVTYRIYGKALAATSSVAIV